MTPRQRIWLCAACLLLLGSSCSAIVDPDLGSLGPPPTCMPAGAINACRCASGEVGAQLCQTNGTLTRCSCDLAGTGTAGRAGSGR